MSSPAGLSFAESSALLKAGSPSVSGLGPSRESSGPHAHAETLLPWLLAQQRLAPVQGPRKRVAVVGGGISGLGAAWALAGTAQVTVFEAEPRLGGHANTVDVTLEGVSHGVDTGFLVCNERTYPLLLNLFEQLGVELAPSRMGFSVQHRGLGLEWAGNDLNSVFAQRSNLVRPAFFGMLTDLLRFNRLTTELAERGDDLADRKSVV